jgi:hypothetical protein|tara:strand:- start:1447 stop:1845 length:399 start_codon:yes stop_codon:yes gene_type:complete
MLFTVARLTIVFVLAFSQRKTFVESKGKLHIWVVQPLIMSDDEDPQPTTSFLTEEIDRLKEYNACLLSDANDMKAMYEAQRLQYILLQEALHDYNEDQEDKFDIYNTLRAIEMSTCNQSAIEINNQLKPQQP